MTHHANLKIFIPILVMAGLLSCEKPEQPGGSELPTQLKKELPFEQKLPLTKFFPELESNPRINKTEYNSYYISLGTQTWNESFKVGEVFIPAQTIGPLLFEADKVVYQNTTWWYLDSTKPFAINQQIPEEFTTLSRADVEEKFRLHIALDETSPFESVTLSNFRAAFGYKALETNPSGGLSIPSLTLTKEGTDFDFNLTRLSGEDYFKGQDGKLYFNAEVFFSATITVGANTIPDPAPESIPILCTLQMDRIDFEKCKLSISSLSFPEKELKGEPFPLPSFLSGLGKDFFFYGPEIYVHYKNTIPSSILKVSVPGVKNSPEIQVRYPDNYVLKPEHDGMGRTGYNSMVFSALKDIFRTPSEDGTLTPRMTVKPAMDREARSISVTPGAEYTISLEADWQLPLLFSGEMTGISVQTAPIYMDGEKLNTPGSGTYLIQSTLQNYLPFDCTVTPVFTLEDNEPVFLDEFTSKANYYGYTFKHTFTSTKDHWKASLYFIITPSKIIHSSFSYDHCMTLEDVRLEFLRKMK